MRKPMLIEEQILKYFKNEKLLSDLEYQIEHCKSLKNTYGENERIDYSIQLINEKYVQISLENINMKYVLENELTDLELKLIKLLYKENVLLKSAAITLELEYTYLSKARRKLLSKIESEISLIVRASPVEQKRHCI